MLSHRKRIRSDVMKLLVNKHDLNVVNDNIQEFYVKFLGPKETPFEGGIWKIHIELPDKYPYKSPSVGFVNKIYHPNIDETSGSVCLDVINQKWSPMFDIVNVLEVFLPQLLKYPNPVDPLNGEAAALFIKEPGSYEKKVKEYLNKYATEVIYNNMATHTDEIESESECVSSIDECCSSEDSC